MNRQDIDQLNFDFDYEQAKQYFYARQFTQAKKILLNKLDSLNAKPKDQYYELLGCATFFENKFSEAENWFNKAILQNQNNPDYFISKAACLIFLNEYESAKTILLRVKDELNFPSIYLNLGKILQQEGGREYEFYVHKEREFASLNQNYLKYKGLEPSFIKEVKTDEIRRQDKAFLGYLREDHYFQEDNKFFDFMRKLEEFSSQRQKYQQKSGILATESIEKILFFSEITLKEYNHLKNFMTQQVDYANKDQFRKILSMMKALVKEYAQKFQIMEFQQVNTSIEAIKALINQIHSMKNQPINFEDPNPEAQDEVQMMIKNDKNRQISNMQPEKKNKPQEMLFIPAKQSDDDLMNKYQKGIKKGNPDLVQPSHQHNKSVIKLMNDLFPKLNNPEMEIPKENNQKQLTVINRKPDFDRIFSQIQVKGQKSFFSENIIVAYSQNQKYLYISDKFKKDYCPKGFINILSQKSGTTKKFYLNFYWLIFLHLFLTEDGQIIDLKSENYSELKPVISYLYHEQFVTRRDCKVEDPIKFSENSLQKCISLLNLNFFTQNHKRQIKINIEKLKSNLEQLDLAFSSFFDSKEKLEFFRNEQPQEETRVFANYFKLTSETIQDKVIEAYLVFVYHLKDKQKKSFQIVSNILKSITEEDQQSFDGRLSMKMNFKQYLQPPSWKQRILRMII